MLAWPSRRSWTWVIIFTTVRPLSVNLAASCADGLRGGGLSMWALGMGSRIGVSALERSSGAVLWSGSTKTFWQSCLGVRGQWRTGVAAMLSFSPAKPVVGRVTARHLS